jgi:hypothetical protein
MDDLKILVGKNKLNFTLLLFIILFGLIHYIKPGFIYNEEGEFRPFGVGYRHKTIIPIWLVSIIVAIFSYLIILSYLIYT